MRIKHIQSGLILAMACLGAVPCAWAVCTGSPALEARIHAHPDAQTYADLGNWFGERNQHGCAIDALHAGLRLDPNSARLNYFLGLNLVASGHAQEALSPLQLSVQFEPDVLTSHLLLATVLDQLQRGEEARVQWEAALHIDPTSAAALDGLAKSMNAAGDYSGAINLLHSVLLNEDLAIDLAFAYTRGGTLDQSADTLTAALRSNPSSVRLTDALASVYIKQHRLQEATELLNKSLSLHPDDAEAERLLLPVFVLSNDFVAARPLAVKMLAHNPHSFDALFLNGIIEHQGGQDKVAREHLKEAVTLKPNDASAHFYLGLTLAGLEDTKGAREQFEQSIAIDPSSREAHYQLATILRTLGETDLAKEQFRITQQMSHTQAQRSLANSKASEAEQKLAAGDVQQAVALYRDAAEADPQDASISYQLSVALDRAGDIAAERTALDQAIALDPSLAPAQNQLGYLISRNGDPIGAEEHFRLAVKAMPAYTEAWINLAATLGMESRYSEAQQALAQALQLDPGNAQAMGLKKDLNAAQSQH